MTRIMTNIAAIDAQRNLEKTGLKMGKVLEKLASGYRINRAADDAAGRANPGRFRSARASAAGAGRDRRGDRRGAPCGRAGPRVRLGW